MSLLLSEKSKRQTSVAGHHLVCSTVPAPTGRSLLTRACQGLTSPPGLPLILWSVREQPVERSLLDGAHRVWPLRAPLCPGPLKLTLLAPSCSVQTPVPLRDSYTTNVFFIKVDDLSKSPQPEVCSSARGTRARRVTAESPS